MSLLAAHVCRGTIDRSRSIVANESSEAFAYCIRAAFFNLLTPSEVRFCPNSVRCLCCQQIREVQEMAMRICPYRPLPRVCRIAPFFQAYCSNGSYPSCKQDISHEDRISEIVIRLRMESFCEYFCSDNDRIFDAIDYTPIILHISKHQFVLFEHRTGLPSAH